MKGWVSLHRQLLDWEWYTDANTVRLFIHCLLKANHTQKTWRGTDIQRGQFLTSIDSLARELSLSSQNIRTSLKKLKSTGEITSKSTSKYSIISIACYDKYQDDNKQNNINLTDKQQTTNKQLTTTNNDNNVNKEKKGGYTGCSSEQIIYLYHKILPELPKVRSIEDWLESDRDKDLKKRLAEKKDRQDIRYWSWFFNHIRNNSWHLESPLRDGWTAKLHWYVEKKQRFNKIEQEFRDIDGI